MKRLLMLLILVLGGCVANQPTESGVDGPGGKADGFDGEFPARLEAATVEEVAARFATNMGQQLDNCFEAYKDEYNPRARMITSRVVERFSSNYPNSGVPADDYCYDWWNLRQTVSALLASEGRQRAYPEDVKEWMEPWAQEQLLVAAPDGIVGYRNLPLGFYYALRNTQLENAMRRAEDPNGVSIEEIRSVFLQEVGEGVLDQDFINPIVIDPEIAEGDELFEHFRELLPLGSLSYVSNGSQAISDFHEAQEGPNGDPDFAEIADQLEQESIQKVFFFEGGGSGWSSHVLVVYDEHSQVWGLTMGYSE